MSRRKDALYAGARGRATLGKAETLGRHWAIQPKCDGAYVTLTTDRDGNISHLLTRTGQPMPRSIAADFCGVKWYPSSVIVGEIEAWTEAARRAVARRGYPMIHVFDAIRVNDRDVSSLPYGDRRDHLLRAESALVNWDIDKPWSDDRTGRAHGPDGRYTRRIPNAWRRVRVVEQRPAAQAENAYADMVDGDYYAPCEGLVAVNLRSKLGAQSSKRKIKVATELDAVVLEHQGRLCALHWVAAGVTFTCGVPAKYGQLEPGEVVEVRHEGFHHGPSLLPRFPRLARRRPDLQQGVATCAV